MIDHERAAEIARELNNLVGSQLSGGTLAYALNGHGGEYYSPGTRLGPNYVQLTVPSFRSERYSAAYVREKFADAAEWKAELDWAWSDT